MPFSRNRWLQKLFEHFACLKVLILWGSGKQPVRSNLTGASIIIMSGTKFVRIAALLFIASVWGTQVRSPSSKNSRQTAMHWLFEAANHLRMLPFRTRRGPRLVRPSTGRTRRIPRHMLPRRRRVFRGLERQISFDVLVLPRRCVSNEVCCTLVGELHCRWKIPNLGPSLMFRQSIRDCWVWKCFGAASFEWQWFRRG